MGRDRLEGASWEGDDEKETLSSEILRSPSGVCADTVRFWSREGKSFEAEGGRGAEIKPWVRGMSVLTPAVLPAQL